MLVVQEAKIADLLLDKPEGLHVDELANKTSLDTDKLKRILRILATKHCFREGALVHHPLPEASLTCDSPI